MCIIQKAGVHQFFRGHIDEAWASYEAMSIQEPLSRESRIGILHAGAVMFLDDDKYGLLAANKFALETRNYFYDAVILQFRANRRQQNFAECLEILKAIPEEHRTAEIRDFTKN